MDPRPSDIGEPAEAPPLEALAPFERLAVRLVRRMNRGRWQRCWFWFQREVGARWIEVVIRRRLRVSGLDHVAGTSRDRPLLIVANHRTLYDLFVVMCVLFRRISGWQAINFPVRGRYFYQTVPGLLANFLAAWWSMWPPFFHTARKRRFDQWALSELARLCRERPGQLVGFHPEGTRNKSGDPWSLLPGQPGVGRLIREARPVVVPVFVAGLTNSFREIATGGRPGAEPIRVRFGPALQYDHLLDLPDTAETYRRIADLVMAGIRDLAEADRREWAHRRERPVPERVSPG
ncbi:MAG TPA: lysophospholipid acyltransferase family protein [Gemmatimonadales bacterium]|jgi:1-acyl-sn-glycerol-3-phosphate acyltransferase|nr:lysophospholipid acyltransferase family protein [Gemmatimonadales bacterium]